MPATPEAAPTPIPEATAPAAPPPAAPEPTEAEAAAPYIPPAPAPVSRTGGQDLGARPLSGAGKTPPRPASATPVDREVAKKPTPPDKPVFAPKKAVPPKTAPKTAAPIKAEPPKAPPKKAAPPAAAAAVDPAKKAKAAAILAKARARNQGAPGEAAPAAKKPSGAELLAKLKAKKSGDEAEAPVAAAPAGARAAAIPSKAPAPRSAAGGSRRAAAATSANRSSSSRRRRDEDEEERGSRHRPAKKSNGNLVLTLVSVIGLAAMGGGYWWWSNNRPVEEGPEEASGASGQNQVSGQPTVDDAPLEAATPLDIPVPPEGAEGDPAANAGAETTDPGAGDPAAGTGDPDPGPAGDPPPKAPKPSAAFTVPGPGEPVRTAGITDPVLITLDLVPPVERWSGCSDEDWTSTVEDLDYFLADSGVMSTRAGDRLIKNGRLAYPALVNQLMKLDYGKKEDLYNATLLNDLLEKIGKGKAFEWKRTGAIDVGTEEYRLAVLTNKMAVAGWQRQWVTSFLTDDAAWEKFSTKTSRSEDGE